MPATFTDLYDFESAIEGAFEQLFANEELKAIRADRAEEFQEERPRIEIKLQSGAETGHHAINTSYRRPDSFTGTLLLMIVTNKQSEGPAATTHNQFRAGVRNIMAKSRDLLEADTEGSDTLLPYHSIMDVVESGTAPSYKNDDGTIVSGITYDIKFNVRPSAWPDEEE